MAEWAESGRLFAVSFGRRRFPSPLLPVSLAADDPWLPSAFAWESRAQVWMWWLQCPPPHHTARLVIASVLSP